MKIQLLPRRSITIKTRLSEAEAFRRLEENINSSKSDSLYTGEDIFTGKVTPSTFIIHQVVPPRTNSFVPVVNGKIRQVQGQTLISVKMQTGGCVIAFVAIFCWPLCLMLYLNLKAWIGGEAFSPSLFFVPLGGISVALLLMNFGFNKGVKAAKAFLIKIFEEEIG